MSRGPGARSRAWGGVLAALLLTQTFLGLYGIAQPVSWGHQGFHVAEHGLSARNLVRHGEWVPSHHHGGAPVDPELSTFHHPILLHPYIVVAQTMFGEAPWTARGVQLLFSLLALGGLWALVRRVRDESTAALTCFAFLVTPLNVAFAHLPDHQLIGLAYMLWAFVGLFDWLHDARRRSLTLWLVASFLSGLTDWPWYPVAFFVFAGLVWRVWRDGLESWHPEMTQRRLVNGLAAFALVVLVPFVAHFCAAYSSPRWADLMVAYQERSASSDFPYFVANTAWRLYALHTPPLVFVTLVWVWQTVSRRRSDMGSLLIFSVLAGQTLWLGAMQIEFLVHEYRSYWYVVPFAFAAGDVGMRWIRSMRAKARFEWIRRQAPTLVLVLLVGWGVWHVRHNLVTSRNMSGSISHQGFNPQHELMTASRLVNALTDPEDLVLIGGGLQPRNEVYYLLDRRTQTIWSPAEAEAALGQGKSVVVMDSVEGLRQHAAWRPLVWKARTLRLGDVAIVDLRGKGPPTMDAGTLVVGENYGRVARFLHAPVPGPVVVADGPAKSALWLARQLASPDKLVDSARRSGSILTALPADLRESTSKAGQSPPAQSR